jgi:hypothetical protein
MQTLAKQILFWDVDRKAMDPEKHGRFIIERILARGDTDDFRWAKEHYGVDVIKEVLKGAKTLDAKSLSFWATYFSLSLDSLCTSKPSLLKRAAFWRR